MMARVLTNFRLTADYEVLIRDKPGPKDGDRSMMAHLSVHAQIESN